MVKIESRWIGDIWIFERVINLFSNKLLRIVFLKKWIMSIGLIGIFVNFFKAVREQNELTGSANQLVYLIMLRLNRFESTG